MEAFSTLKEKEKKEAEEEEERQAMERNCPVQVAKYHIRYLCVARRQGELHFLPLSLGMTTRSVQRF